MSFIPRCHKRSDIDGAQCFDADGHPGACVFYDSALQEVNSQHLLERMKDVACEVIDAETKHGNFHSAHEGWAVIEEEAMELQAEVFTRKIDYKKVYAEAMQLAAMSIKMMQLAREKF